MQTVAQIAEAYRTDWLVPQRERADEAWTVIQRNVLDAQPDPHKPPFGEWPAREVKTKDIVDVVRLAKAKRAVGNRVQGGPGRDAYTKYSALTLL